MAPERPRLLATDDRPEILRLIERTLGEHYECEFAGSVAAAREALRGSEFDLALCDIQMPGESGLTLAAEITGEHPHTAVVLVTGEDHPDVAERAFAFGVHGYLVKPFWPGQLLITAMNALRRRDLELAEKAHADTLEERLQALMDRAPVPVYMKDRERRYVLANQVVHDLWGIEPGGLIGRTTKDLVPAAADRQVEEADRAILERGGSHEAEETLPIRGAERSFLTVKFPNVDDAGAITGVWGISTEITDRKRADALRDELSAARERAIAELHASRQETVDRLTRAIERHDAGTGEHVSRMATVAAFLGHLHGFNRDQVLLLRAAAPMHDIGKVATPDQILRKPGPLTAAERIEMERHTTVGYEILAGSESDLLQLGAQIALTHHERWDGRGYPRGLSGAEIPIEARIVAVADVFDALLSDRSYRGAMPIDEVVAIIRGENGTHFDPDVADLLLDHVEEAVALRV
jgi:PAS domain S-box-containing protein